MIKKLILASSIVLSSTTLLKSSEISNDNLSQFRTETPSSVDSSSSEEDFNSGESRSAQLNRLRFDIYNRLIITQADLDNAQRICGVLFANPRTLLLREYGATWWGDSTQRRRSIQIPRPPSSDSNNSDSENDPDTGL